MHTDKVNWRGPIAFNLLKIFLYFSYIVASGDRWNKAEIDNKDDDDDDGDDDADDVTSVRCNYVESLFLESRMGGVTMVLAGGVEDVRV